MYSGPQSELGGAQSEEEEEDVAELQWRLAAAQRALEEARKTEEAAAQLEVLHAAAAAAEEELALAAAAEAAAEAELEAAEAESEAAEAEAAAGALPALVLSGGRDPHRNSQRGDMHSSGGSVRSQRSARSSSHREAAAATSGGGGGGVPIVDLASLRGADSGVLEGSDAGLLDALPGLQQAVDAAEGRAQEKARELEELRRRLPDERAEFVPIDETPPEGDSPEDSPEEPRSLLIARAAHTLAASALLDAQREEAVEVDAEVTDVTDVTVEVDEEVTDVTDVTVEVDADVWAPEPVTCARPPAPAFRLRSSCLLCPSPAVSK